MKNLIFCICISAFGLFSCHSAKEVSKQPTDVVEDEGTKPENVDHGSAQSTVERVVGIVRMEENCGAILEVTYGDVIYRYFPINLEEKYKKEGLSIKFAFDEQFKSPPIQCEVINMVVAVSDVTPVR